jgi:multiple sugar transport system substrate-binding protein
MSRRVLIWAVLLLLLFGCKGAGGTSGKTEVVFWHAMPGTLGDALNRLVDEFNRTHSDIHVKAISMGDYRALSTKLMAAMQTNQRPDVAQAFESWTAKLIEGNNIVPMDDFIKNDPSFTKESIDDIFPVFRESNTINGKLWSMPFNKSVRVMYYNKDMLFVNGINPNKPPVTWDDFRAYSRKLTQDKNHDGTPEIWGTTLTVSAWQFENLLLQAGGDILSEDGTRSRFQEEPGIQALQYLSTLLNEDKSAYLSTGKDSQNDFLAGKVGMMEDSSVSLAFMQATGINFVLGVGPIPVKETKRNIISGTNVVIVRNKNPKVEKAAWEFVKWFTDTKQTAKWSEDTYYMPVRKSALEEPGLKKRLEMYPEIALVYDQLNYATFEPQQAAWFEARKYLEENVLERVMRKQATPRAALDQAAREIDKKLKAQ